MSHASPRQWLEQEGAAQRSADTLIISIVRTKFSFNANSSLAHQKTAPFEKIVSREEEMHLLESVSAESDILDI